LTEVSVIVATRNRAAILKRFMEALAAQEPVPGGFELVVVDDFSRDDTPSVCGEAARSSAWITYLRAPGHVGIPAAQNIGIRASSGRKLLFTDDDCVPGPDWVRRMSEALDSHPVVGCAIAEAPGRGYVMLSHHVALVGGFLPSDKAGPANMLAGGGMGLTRAAFDRIGALAEDQTRAFDTECSLRARSMGLDVWLDRRIVTVHDPPCRPVSAVMRYAWLHAGDTILLRRRYAAVLRTPFILRNGLFLTALSPVIALGVVVRLCLDGLPLRMWHTLPLVWALKVAWCLGAAKGIMPAARKAGRPR